MALSEPQFNLLNVNLLQFSKHLSADSRLSDDNSFQKTCPNGSCRRRASNFRLRLVPRKRAWRNYSSEAQKTGEATERRKCCLVTFFDTFSVSKVPVFLFYTQSK